MRRIPNLPAALVPLLLLLASCGGEPAEEPTDQPPGEAVEAGPPLSDDPAAQAAYDESLELWSSDGPASMAKLHEAIELDPGFLDAHALLANRYAYIYQMWDRSDSIADNALAYAEHAMEMDPDAPGALSAMGAYHYRIRKDYDRAMEIYSRAVDLYPNDASFLRMHAHVARRQGDWDRALEILTRSEAVEPSLGALQAIMENHRYNRRWDEAMAAGQEYAKRAPESTTAPSYMAWIAFYRDGDTGPLREFLSTRPTGWSTARWNLEMLDRNYAEALAIMDAATVEVFTGQYGLVPRSFYRGLALRRMGDETAATAAFREARSTMEGMLPEYDHDCRVYRTLGEIYAILGMREAAVAAANHAVELVSPDMDALVGPHNLMTLATVYAELGETEGAVELIRRLMAMPSAVSPGGLARAPRWDAIRDDPAFQALMAG